MNNATFSAIAFASILATISAVAANPPEVTYELRYETASGDVYVVDYDLTLDDCRTAKAHFAAPTACVATPR